MRYTCFVSWKPADIDGILQTPCPTAIKAFEEGDNRAMVEYYMKYATIETLKTAEVRRGGWKFYLREYCRRYWVKTRYDGIQELYAPSKGCIRHILGDYHVLRIEEVL